MEIVDWGRLDGFASPRYGRIGSDYRRKFLANNPQNRLLNPADFFLETTLDDEPRRFYGPLWGPRGHVRLASQHG